LTNYAFMKAAQEKAEACWDKLQKATKKNYPMPRITFDLRSIGTAGIAQGASLIRLNMGYIAKADEMLRRTVPHEICHCWLAASGDSSHVRSAYDAYSAVTTGRRRRRSPHGPAFMSLMRFFGIEETRTHTMGKAAIPAGSSRRLWAYKCSGCGYKYQLSTNIHNKITRGQHRFHPSCGRERGRIVRDL
jgi:predicted SprT family Zn-dependent metalloprotease